MHSPRGWASDVSPLPLPPSRGRYEHLVNLLTKILNQRPEDPLSILESLNRTTQMEWFHPKLDTLRDDPEMQPTYEMAERQKALFGRRGSSGSGEGEQEMEEEVVSEPGGGAWQVSGDLGLGMGALRPGSARAQGRTQKQGRSQSLCSTG